VKEREDPQLHAMGSWKTMLEVMMLLTSLQQAIGEQTDEDSLQLHLMQMLLASSSSTENPVCRPEFQLEISIF
jgi:hypothetical protein